MPAKLEKISQHMVLEDDDRQFRTREELTVLEFDIIDTLEEDPLFQESDGGVYISRHERSDYRPLEQHLVKSGVRKQVAKKFVELLGKNKGGFFADILGFKPVKLNDSDDDTSDVDLLFGKLYIPTLSGFQTKFSIEKTNSKKSDISIKVAGIGAGGSKEYFCKITQDKTLSSTPVDLVIQARVKLVKWEHFLGEVFYTCHPINISRRIVGQVVENPYEREGGYDEITSMPGIVDRYDTSSLQEEEKVTEELVEKTKINLNANLRISAILADVKVDGIATVNNKIDLIYSLPAGYQYATYVQNNKDFQHLWAMKY